ncbi:MAG: DinB family protein [Acidobacteria bacterium]|nr:DinB family protein [Acidobacteriota bacterium]
MKALVCTLAAFAIASAAHAQAPAAPKTTTAQQPPTRVELSTWLKSEHERIKLNLTQSAAKMSDADYRFKPAGVAAEVRDFGMFIGHLATSNNLYCALADGKPIGSRPQIGRDEKSGNEAAANMSKDELVKALADALTYCDSVYARLTDANAMEMIALQAGNTTRQVTRVQYLIANLAHNNEHYGNIVTYLRAKGLVPPSTERASQPRR